MEPKEQIVVVITHWEDDPESGWKPTNPESAEDEKKLTVEVYRCTKSFFTFEGEDESKKQDSVEVKSE